MIILQDNQYPMNNEVISFVIFDIEFDFSRLNEVHRHNKVVMNSKEMMDQILNHSYRPIRHPKHDKLICIQKEIKRSLFTSGQLSKLSTERIDRSDRRSLNVLKSL